MNSQTQRRIAWVGAAVVVLLVALWTRTRELNAPDFWSDEAYSLYHLRSGTTSGLIGRHVGGREAGWLAGALMAVSYLAVILSRQIRPYALGLLWVEAVIWFTLRLIARGNGRDVWQWLLVSALGLFTNYLIALTIGSAWLSVLWLGRRREMWKPLAVMGIGAGLTAITLLPLALAQAAWSAPTLAWIPPPQIRQVAQTVDAFVLGMEARRWPLMAVLLIVPTLVVLALLSCYRMVKDGGARRAPILILFLPLAAAYIASLRQSIFLPRYLFVTLPPLCLVLAYGIKLITTRWRMAVGAVVAAGALAAGAAPYPFDERIPWSAVAGQVAAQAREGEGIIFAPLYDRLPFESKYDGPSLRAVGVLDYADYVPRAGQIPFAVTVADVNEYFGSDGSFWIVEDAGWPVGGLPGWRVSEQYAYPGATLLRWQKASP